MPRAILFTVLLSASAGACALALQISAGQSSPALAASARPTPWPAGVVPPIKFRKFDLTKVVEEIDDGDDDDLLPILAKDGCTKKPRQTTFCNKFASRLLGKILPANDPILRIFNGTAASEGSEMAQYTGYFAYFGSIGVSDQSTFGDIWNYAHSGALVFVSTPDHIALVSGSDMVRAGDSFNGMWVPVVAQAGPAVAETKGCPATDGIDTGRPYNCAFKPSDSPRVFIVR